MTVPDRPTNRVAYVLKRYPRYSETFVVNEILAHEAAGLEIHIFALRPPTDPYFQPAISQVEAPVTYLHDEHLRADALWSRLHEFGVEVPRLWSQLSACGKTSGTEMHQALQLAQQIRSRGIDHIHAHFATTAASVARVSSLFTGVAYSFTAHAKDIFHESVDPVDLAQKIEDASAVVTVSDFNVQFLAARFNGLAHKCRRIYNGLDLEQFHFARPDRRPPRIVAVGRLVEKKGFDSLIAACALLRQAGIEFQCEIIGGGELEPQLRRRVVELNLDTVIRLSGPHPQTYVQEAIRSAALVAVPSETASNGDRDGLPTVLLEAMALGTPCVATSLTGIPEAIHDEHTGLLVLERQPQQLATALKRLLFDVDLRVRLAYAARHLVERQFDIQQNAAELRTLFSSGRQVKASPLSLAEVG